MVEIDQMCSVAHTYTLYTLVYFHHKRWLQKKKSMFLNLRSKYSINRSWMKNMKIIPINDKKIKYYWMKFFSPQLWEKYEKYYTKRVIQK